MGHEGDKNRSSGGFRHRLLLVSSDFPPHVLGGGAVVCDRLALEYQRLGKAVGVIAMDTSRVGLFAPPEVTERQEATVSFLPLALRASLPGASLLLVLPPSLPGFIRVVREIHAGRWDAAHLHGNPSTLVDLSALLCVLNRRPFVVTFHGVIRDPSRLGGIASSIYRLLRVFERRIFSHAVAITAVSPSTLAEVRDAGFHSVKMRVIPNAGFPGSTANPAMESGSSTKVRRRDVEPGEFVLCLGAFIPRKGQDILLEAFARLARSPKFPSRMRLVLAGFERDRAFLERLRARTSELGLTDRVVFLGPVSDPERATLLSTARWVVMPSRYEASPVLAFEALSMGCVLVAPDLESFRAVVGETGSAVMYRPEDVSDLARVLSELAENATAERQLRAAAKLRSQAFPSWSGVAREYLALWSSPAGRNGPA